MEFHSLKRRDLQILCKKNNIPANTTNAAMADALASLHLVEGIEEFLGQTEVKDVSPERSVVTSSNMPRTSTRHRVCIEESECSRFATRTRCSTRRNAVAGTESKQTPATRTSRRTARKIQNDIQAEYEASLEESQVSENKELLSNECESVEEPKLSGVVDQDDNVPSENQVESQGQVYDQEEVVNEAPEVSSGEMLNVNLKVDFHSLSRKQLQNLCKRNKIPANITNAAMIDALEALECMEGVEDLLKESDPLGVKSPETSRMTSSRVRQSRTAHKTTCLKPAQTCFALGKMSVQKKDDPVVECLAKKMDSTMEDIESSVSICTAEGVLSKEVENDEHNHREALQEKLDVLDCDSENDSGFRAESKSLSEKSSDGSETSVVVETPKEPLNDVVDENSHPTNIVPCDDASVLKESPLSKIENTSHGDASETDGDHQEFEANELVELSANNESLETKVLDESDTSLMMENIEEFQDNVIENEDEEENDSFEAKVHDSSTELASKPVADQKTAVVLAQEEIISSEALFEKTFVNEAVGLMPEAPLGTEGLKLSDNSIFNDMQDDDSSICFRSSDDMEILNRLGDRVDELDGTDFGDMSNVDSIVVEVTGDVESFEGSKSLSYGTTQDEDRSFDSDSVQYSVKKQEIIQLEGSCTDDQMTKKLCSESTEHAPKPKGTPLNHKSLRKLKKILKEELQVRATALLTSKMGKLTLEGTDLEPIQEACLKLEEECDKIETPSCVLSTIVSGIAEAPVPAVVIGNDDLHEEYTQTNIDKAVNDPIVDAATQIQICVESVNSNSTLKLEGNDVSEKQSTEHASLQFTPTKALRKTPSKTTMSGGRKNNALDMATNKENIDKSGTRTGTGKTEMAVFETGKLLSPLSMRKLKKELQQQSEKKRIALQSRSENQCPLSSP